VLYNDVSHTFGSALRAQDDTNICSTEETAQRFVDLLVCGVSLNDQEVLNSTLVSLAHSSEEKTYGC